MVGAIADWFAVTALFRHPLGLPIPHTALIPTRKNMLARSLQDFVTENFLSEQVVRARVQDAQVARRVARWLAEGDHSARVVDEASEVVRAALLRIDDREVAALLKDELLPRIAEEPLSVLAGQLLQEILTDGAHRGLVDLAFSETHTWLVENPETVAQVLSSRAPWWTPQWLDDKVVAPAARRGPGLGRGDPRRPRPRGPPGARTTCWSSSRTTCRPTRTRSSGPRRSSAGCSRSRRSWSPRCRCGTRCAAPW